MKKIICCIVFIIVISIIFSSCGNMGVGIGNYTFTHIHFSDGVNESYCATVERWRNNEIGIEVKTKEFGSIFLAEGLYTLFESENNCPYC